MGTATGDTGRGLRVGVVGAGLMGGAMVERLRACGHEVAVRDIDQARETAAAAVGARVLASAGAVAAVSDLVIVAVVDATQTEAVLFGEGGIARGARGATAAPATWARPPVMLCPTIGPADVERFAARLAGAGHACIDAPMSGGPARARDGSMSLMVACDDVVWTRWQPLLGQLAQRLFRVGTRHGDGARTKLVNNLLAAIHLTAGAEALALADRLGLDPATTLAVVEQSSGQSWIATERGRRWLDGDQAPRAHMRLLAKDAALALAAAREVGIVQPLGERAAAAFAAACADGLADADDAALIDYLRGRLEAR